MSPSSVSSFALVGVDAFLVDVEVDILRRLPATQIVGLSAASVREAAERVRSAIHASGFEWPRQRVVVNLAPADLRKDGQSFDLPIAIAVLVAIGEIPPDSVEGCMFAGELSLGGDLRPIRGSVAAAGMADSRGLTLYLPVENATTCAALGGSVVGCRTLAQVVDCLRGEDSASVGTATPGPSSSLDFAEVRGNPRAIRAALIAVAGGHHLAMTGAPGCGKTMIAARIPSIMPTMDRDQAAEVARVHDAAGLLAPGASLPSSRPFRAPHHSISAAGMLGSALLRPGEVSLAHGGVLFLDEVPEFMRPVLELVKHATKDRQVVLQRALGTVRFPAYFTLVTAANPCPCGFHGHPRRECSCSEEAVERYQSRGHELTGTCDVRVNLEPISSDSLMSATKGPTSASLREQVEKVWAKWPPLPADNASWVYGNCMSSEARKAFMAYTADNARSNRIARVALTIAHLDGRDEVIPSDITEAATFTE